MTQDQLVMVATPSMNDTHLEEMMIINKLSSAAKNSEVENILEILKELLEHTTLHFSQEEEMMQKALFSELNSHKAEHDRHLHELKSLINYFQTNRDPRAITAYIDGNLIPWSIHHVKTMDTTAAEFLKNTQGK